MTASDDDETAPDAAGAAADPLAATLAAVRTETTPEAAERTELHSVVADLIDRAGAAVESLPSPADEADVLHVGSTARGTWLPGDRDVDLFVRFPTALDREELEEYGLRVGHETLPDSREAFAEHPYVVGSYDGFDVDLVPCFDVASATEIRSAVDRTPFHTAYLDERLDGDLAADVRVFKQFLTAIGAYGSDLRTRGFSGYLAELLVVVYGGVEPLLRAAGEEWHPPVRFDPEEHGTETFDDPLVVIDPTDPERNVAAVCAPANVARLQHHARQLLDDPDTERFRRREREPLDADAVAEHVTRRGTDPVAVVVDVPPLVDDQLYPQLRRSLAGIERELDGRGFDVLRSTTFATDLDEPTASDTNLDESATFETDPDGPSATPSSDSRRVVLFVEIAHAQLPTVERHEGPPVAVEAHATGFYEKYAGPDGSHSDAYGPFLDGDRYVVERDREWADAAALLDSDALLGVALGARIEEALADGYEVYAGDEVSELATTFGDELRDYFDPRV